METEEIIKLVDGIYKVNFYFLFTNLHSKSVSVPQF